MASALNYSASPIYITYEFKTHRYIVDTKRHLHSLNATVNST